ncbi:MAG: hypothetical protein WCS73_01925 [Lentisphaeria bacterium]
MEASSAISLINDLDASIRGIGDFAVDQRFTAGFRLGTIENELRFFCSCTNKQKTEPV